MKEHFDVVIAGGGPAGSVLALTLARQGLSAAIIEKSSWQSFRIGETLSPAVNGILAELELKDLFSEENHIPSWSILSAWGDSTVQASYSMMNPYGNGWHVDRKRFDQMLVQAAQSAGVSLFPASILQQVTKREDRSWEIIVNTENNQHQLHANYLVDATGRAATLSHRLGARRQVYDHLIGIARIYDLQPGKEPDHHLLIEATRSGWWYTTTLPGCKQVVVYMTDADLYSQGHKNDPAYWDQELEKTIHIPSKIIDSQSAGKPWAFSATSTFLNYNVNDNWFAAGDAGMSFDPLSARGIYSAMQSGKEIAALIMQHHNDHAQAKELYMEACRTKFNKYLEQRHHYYMSEQRWRDAPFWKRRQAEIIH